jgi:hypothetical protein
MLKLMKLLTAPLVLTLLFSFMVIYPYDGYEYSGIRRLARLQMIIQGQLKGSIPPPGGRKQFKDIKLNLISTRADSLKTFPPNNPELQKKIEALFPNRDESYSVAVLDISPGKKMRFASRQIDRQFAPGSVGKLLIAAGLFKELQRLYPDDVNKRLNLLKTHIIKADKWINVDTHEIPIFNSETNQFSFRAAKEGDSFTLFEWADHMLSQSANAAASIVWKELILMRKFGKSYPISYEAETQFFKTASKKELQDSAMSIVNDPVREIGIAEKDWRLGSFFTNTGKKIVPSSGSYATPRGLMQYLIALESGKVVDEWSSLEIKRLMYMTAKRIRYASSPALADDAVYYKSGSQYKCKPEEGFSCGKYKGNVENYMNSVAIVEKSEDRIYLVALMSNVLKKNSAVEHQSLATFIDRALWPKKK